jgi:hypothetical protein
MALSQLHTKFITIFFSQIEIVLCKVWFVLYKAAGLIARVDVAGYVKSDFRLSNCIITAYLVRGFFPPIHAYHDDDG